MEKPKYYITTPIYYPSGRWHLGTCYTTVICDAIARFKRMDGYDVFYLTGTDEHGQKIEKTAAEKGMTPKAFLDMQVDTLKKVWDRLHISYDKFIRTTDADHEEQVKKIFQKLYDQGDIYKAEYEGWYCVPCESFWTKAQLKDGKCPDCGREVQLTKEESYFFRLSKYQDKLIRLIEDNPEWLEPKSRQNEMLNNFLRPGLQDLCVTRSSFKWGVEVPFDKNHIIYVWIDALANYITALGCFCNDKEKFEKYWPADLHMMGKEIVRFHSVIWPALLMALDLPLPKKVYGHGWLLLGGDKISKSKGNIVDPLVLSDRYSVDAVRYYLLREVPFGNDGVYTNHAFLTRLNTDLCNNLGNLLSRTTAMVNQYFGGVLPASTAKEEMDEELISMANGMLNAVRANIEKLLISEALQEIFRTIQRANKYIDETTPWILAKDETKRKRLGTVLYNLTEVLRMAAVMLTPFLVETPKAILSHMGLDVPESFDGVAVFGALKAGTPIKKAGKLFPRIDVEKEVKTLEDAAERAEEEKQKAAKAESEKKEKEKKPMITFDDFGKIELKVGKILTAEKVEKSRKLLKFTVEVGDEVRTIVSGISDWYTPEETIGKLVTVVTNLAPAKLCGIVSEGMLLCAEDKNGNVVLMAPEKEVASGSGVS